MVEVNLNTFQVLKYVLRTILRR